MAIDPRFKKQGGKAGKFGKPNYAAVADIELPQCTYSSVKPGPSYGQMFVAPPEDQFIDLREPALMQQRPTALEMVSPDDLPDRGALIEAGDTALKAVGSAAESVGGVVGDAAESVGTFFSGLFGGGNEEEAKNQAKARLKQKMQRGPQGVPVRKIYKGKAVPVSAQEFNNLK